MKTAIVTGGTSGIGLGVAKMLISKGYYVYATYVGEDFNENIENFEAPLREFENKIDKYEELREYLRDIKTIQGRIKEKKKLLEETKIKITQIEEALKEYKVCPLCHKPL